jgi:hypothetical protein
MRRSYTPLYSVVERFQSQHLLSEVRCFPDSMLRADYVALRPFLSAFSPKMLLLRCTLSIAQVGRLWRKWAFVYLNRSCRSVAGLLEAEVLPPNPGHARLTAIRAQQLKVSTRKFEGFPTRRRCHGLLSGDHAASCHCQF